MEPAHNEQAAPACLALAGVARKNNRPELAREWLQKARALATATEQPDVDC